MQIHIDPLGGWSGDMFVAAMLDAAPHLWPEVQANIAALRLGPQSDCRFVPHHDGVLKGSRFLVAAEGDAASSTAHSHGDHHHPHDHHHDHPHDHHHHHGAGDHGGHRAWAEIRAALLAAPLEKPIADAAVGIFTLLAEAEAEVHACSVDEVSFHEVGAVDSIVDIVSAATAIVRLDATRWTAAPLPLGGGRVKTAHGLLPVPAPATALLLRGLDTVDDGVSGERVTPTGAAVARFLLQGARPGKPTPRRLLATGTGFGTRTLPGLSNCLRVLLFEETGGTGTTPAYGHRELGVVEFEVDDQSAEELAHALDHLRALPGVHDVIQSIAFGKKGRMATHVQLLVRPEDLDAAIRSCFTETTTIGLRYHIVQGAALQREVSTVSVGDQTLRVKSVARPDGEVTGKVEASDVAALPGHTARSRLRRAGEAAALSARQGKKD